MAIDENLDLHVGDELDIAGPAVTERGAEGIQRIAALAELDSIHLHLLAHGRFKAHHRLVRLAGPEGAQERTPLITPYEQKLPNFLLYVGSGHGHTVQGYIEEAGLFEDNAAGSLLRKPEEGG
jgi:hypothetical protein